MKFLSQKTVLASKLIISLLVLFAFALPLPRAAAQDFGGACEGVRITGDRCDNPNDTQAESAINRTIRRALYIFSAVAGIVAVAMIIFAGFRYITAGGDSSKIATAQQTIIYAVVGLVIAALAQVIARYVLQQAT